jgi:hypothetical protein
LPYVVTTGSWKHTTVKNWVTMSCLSFVTLHPTIENALI